MRHSKREGRSPMGKRPVLTFSHVGIWVSDLETMRRFYTDVLGFVETLKAMYATIVHKPVKDLVQISHGNAWSIYFKDPEGNRVELFVDTPWYTPQPCREPLDRTKPVEQLMKETDAYCRSRPGFATHAPWQGELRDKSAASR